MFEDKVLVCKDCGQEFVFTAGEQEFYEAKGFQNEPGRCKECRSTRKAQFNGGSARRERELFDTVCADCGKETKVPFKPRLDKPVYCSECYANRNALSL
jgi:CxxC-x17-CxxC domain-containing protein